MARSKTEAAKSKVESAVALGGLGAGLGGPVGGTIGALTGLIIGDQTLVFQMPYIAVPAFEYYGMVANGGHTPSHMIYIKEGEVLTQVIETEAQEAEEVIRTDNMSSQPKRKKSTPYQRKYKKAFAKEAPKHKKKDGTWKKDGFKAAVKAAHRMCK